MNRLGYICGSLSQRETGVEWLTVITPTFSVSIVTNCQPRGPPRCAPQLGVRTVTPNPPPRWRYQTSRSCPHLLGARRCLAAVERVVRPRGNGLFLPWQPSRGLRSPVLSLLMDVCGITSWILPLTSVSEANTCAVYLGTPPRPRAAQVV